MPRLRTGVWRRELRPAVRRIETSVPEVEVRLTQVYKAFGGDAVGRRVAKYIQPGESGLIVAVDHIDLEVQDGEFFSLLGPSGCGKTTTLRMIGGFEQPTSGLIELAGSGRDLAAALPAQRQHGLPELRTLPPPLDLRERRLRAASSSHRGVRGQAARLGNARTRGAARATSAASRPRSPVVRPSASRSRGR